jgi:hypothetical protein
MDLGALETYLTAGAAETRRLKSVLYGLALLSGRPVEALQVAYGAIWFGIGVATDRVAALLFPATPRLPLIAGALVLCATGDLLTNSLVMLGYNLAMLAFLTALYCLLRWLDGGARGWLAAAPLVAFASLSINEGALVSIVVTPAILIVSPRDRTSKRRLTVGLLVWGAAVALHLVRLVSFLTREGSYASIAFVPLGLEERLARVAWLFGENFAPWRWVVARPRWIGAHAPSVLPDWWMVAVALVAAGLFALALRRRSAAAAGGARRREWTLVALFLFITLLCNAAFSGLVLSNFLYRTQAASRLWAALAVAALVALPRWRGRLTRSVASLVPIAFVALGAAGGAERQDYYLATWSDHRRELVSILGAVPSLAPRARLVLYLPADAQYEATEVLYLARSWLVLLYDDPSIEQRGFLWAGHDLVGCRPGPSGLACWNEGRKEEFLRDDASGWQARYEDLVLLVFDRTNGEYELVRSLPDERLPVEGPGTERYDPTRNIRTGSASALTGAILVDSPWPKAPSARERPRQSR